MNSPLPAVTLKLDVCSVERLLDADGSPLTAPRIHPEAAQAIWDDAKMNAGGKARFHVAVTVPPGDLARVAEVRAGIAQHFTRERDAADQELREIYRDAWRSSCIGVAAATLLLIASELLLNFGTRPFMEAAGRALIILAWVALWHPADLLIYAHLPVRRKRDLARALAGAEVTLRPR